MGIVLKIKRVGVLFLCMLGAVASWAKGPTTAIVVDKKTNTLTVTEYVDGKLQTVFTTKATLGKVKGDKEVEGDNKTPEGIYTALAVKKEPGKKFGRMAFHLNFPNTFDKMAGRKGSNIMLHATDWPERLKQDYDSEGCIVVRNEDIIKIAPYIRLGLTPFLIYDELKPAYLDPGPNDPGLIFFKKWIADWESRDIEKYISDYHSEFSAQGMDKEGWKKFKGALTKRYSEIHINPEDIKVYQHPKYRVITFTQNYQSRLRDPSGRKPDLGRGYTAHGSKILYVAEEDGQPKIVSESYSNLMW